jgi:ectoine hydroxylase-related dioxygenase (phytanoyl-CoA dioxygenase family)
MGFQVSDKHIGEYHMLGYTVFRNILPPSLIRDLRQVSDRAKATAREQSGPQVQRLQPVANYDLDQQPFIDYANLPPLVDAIAKVLTPRHRHGDRDHFGILFEPADMPYCTPWHRDWRDNAAGLPLSMWDEVFSDINHFNQINCALYEDSSTWFVLGSHLRRDLPAEIERFPDRPIPSVDLDGKSAEEREPLCLEYCRSMPGAVQVHLEAGDFALYRNTLWHFGNYVPYRKRATLHDSAWTPEFETWYKKARTESSKRREAGFGMENPNLNVIDRAASTLT